MTLNSRTVQVHATRCPFSGGLVFRAWEEITSLLQCDHQTVSTLGLGGKFLGLVGSEMHRAEIDPLVGMERVQRFEQLRAESAAFAREAILVAFPELNGCCQDGYLGTTYEILGWPNLV